MRYSPISDDFRQIWKTFPLRIPGGSECDSCAEQTILVAKSTSGPFVTRNCPQCEKSGPLPESVFMNGRNVYCPCPNCGGQMEPEKPGNAHVYQCIACDIYIELADIVPWDHDLKMKKVDREAGA